VKEHHGINEALQTRTRRAGILNREIVVEVVQGRGALNEVQRDEEQL